MFMDIKDFKALNSMCGYGKVEALKPQQIELIMNEDVGQYYIKRCQYDINGPEPEQPKPAAPEKKPSEKGEDDESSEESGSSESV